MARQKYHTSGTVTDIVTRRGINKLRVEVWDKDKKLEKPLGTGVTDEKGEFRLSLDEALLSKYPPDRLPDVFLKIYRGRTLIKDTENLLSWNAGTDPKATIEVERTALESSGQDRITARQVFNGAAFVEKSDFRGVKKESEDKFRAAFGFVRDMVINTTKKMDIKPIKVGDHRTSDVLNQDETSARENLEKQRITVKEVKKYEPGLNAKSIAEIASFPMRLEPNQEVDLYKDEAGKIRYYSIVKKRTPADINASDVVRLDNDVKDIKSRIGKLDTLDQDLVAIKASALNDKNEMMEKVALVEADLESTKHSAESDRNQFVNAVDLVKEDLATLKRSLQADKTNITKEVDFVKTRLTVLDKAERELEALKAESASNSKQIATLQSRLQELKTTHDKIKKDISPQRIAKLEQDIAKLNKFKTDTLKILRNRGPGR